MFVFILITNFKAVTREVAERQQCSANNWEFADNFNHFPATAVIEWSNTVPSSIVTAIHRNHTIAFVGTSDGNLIKVMYEIFDISDRLCCRLTLNTGEFAKFVR